MAAATAGITTMAAVVTAEATMAATEGTAVMEERRRADTNADAGPDISGGRAVGFCK